MFKYAICMIGGESCIVISDLSYDDFIQKIRQSLCNTLELSVPCRWSNEYDGNTHFKHITIFTEKIVCIYSAEDSEYGKK
jgi:hypothetical protein